jgi:hypothetical protein
MFRLYYLINDIETTKQAYKDLEREGVSENNIHVWSKDEAGLKRRHLHSLGFIEKNDLIRSGEQGAMIGIVCGLLLASILSIIDPFKLEMSLMASMLIVVLVMMFGAWAGGLIGFSHDNYKLAKFHDSIAIGKYLLIADVTSEQERNVRASMDKYHNRVSMEGKDTTYTNPLEGFPFSSAIHH